MRSWITNLTVVYYCSFLYLALVNLSIGRYILSLQISPLFEGGIYVFSIAIALLLADAMRDLVEGQVESRYNSKYSELFVIYYDGLDKGER